MLAPAIFILKELAVLLIDLSTPVSTGQILESEATHEVACAAMATTDHVLRYTCIASPESTPNR